MTSRPTPASTATICAFVALELPRAIQMVVAQEIPRLEKELPGIMWMDPHRTHITLRFLGWTTRERLTALEPYLKAGATACAPMDTKVAHLGTFPPHGPSRPRVLWVGVDLPQSGITLQSACDSAAVACGFPPERRIFRAHVTLGRWKEPARLGELPALDLGATRLERLVLFRTEPGKDSTIPGVRREVSAYSKLAVFPLGG
jgi:RNA 2',3'-cyclic 3'-phosphodiesterase